MLSPKELEALALLMEECGETIQAAAKILRHGKTAVDETDGHLPMAYDNVDQLRKELVDLLVTMDLFNQVWKLLPHNGLADLCEDKQRRLRTYLHHINIEEEYRA